MNVIRFFLIGIMVLPLVFSIAVSPPKYVVNDPVPGEDFHFEFHFSKRDGGAINYDINKYGGAPRGSPGFEEEVEWFNSISNIPRTTPPDPWGSTVSTIVVEGVWPTFQSPGTREIVVSGADAPVDGVGMMALAGISASIYINVPYEGTYASLVLDIDNYALDEMVSAEYTVKSTGKTSMEKVDLFIDVYNGDGLLDSFGLGEVTFENGVVSDTFNLSMYPSGLYNASLLAVEDGKEYITWTNFIVSDNQFHAVCGNIYAIPSIHENRFSVSSGFLNNLSSEITVQVDGEVVGSELFDLRALSDEVVPVYLHLDMEKGEYAYGLHVDGNELCTGSIFINDPTKVDTPMHVYVVVIIAVLGTVIAIYFYMRRQDTEEDTEF